MTSNKKNIKINQYQTPYYGLVKEEVLKMEAGNDYSTGQKVLRQ